MTRQRIIAVAVCCSASASSALAAPMYDVTVIGEITYTSGVNDSGHATGYASFPGVTGARGFLYDGTMRNIGTLGQRSTGTAINDLGQIVGFSDIADFTPRAYLYDGTMHDLGTLGGEKSYAYDINNAGSVTGFSSLPGDASFHAYVYDGAMHDLGTLGGPNSSGFAINGLGHVTGSADTPEGRRHAFLYDGKMHDLGTPEGAIESIGRGINDSGQIVGRAIFRDEFGVEYNRAFLHDGAMRDLGTLGGLNSYALDINESGQIVGGADGEDGRLAAFLYSNGEMFNLNDAVAHVPDIRLAVAQDISDSGYIVAQGQIGIFDRAFLLTPVPEPSSLVLTISGLAVVVCAIAGAKALGDRRSAHATI